LRRRLFLWFAASILLATLSGAVAFWLTRDVTAQGFYRRSLDLVGVRFAHVWDSPSSRQQLARDIATVFDAHVVLRGPHEQRLGGVGSCDQVRRSTSVDVMVRGRPEGRVVLCLSPDARSHGGGFWLSLGVAVLVLWALAGALARRLLRPLEKLEHTARQLGDGRLDSRVELDQDAVGEVGQLARTFNEMAQRLEELLAAQRELLAAVSHEVRSPLGRMRLLLELGRTHGLEPQRIERLEQEVTEIDDLVAELLAAARLDFSGPDRRAVHIRDFVADLLDRSGDRVPLDDETGNLRVSVDPTLLGRALSNLLSNARTHGGGATCVRLTLKDQQLFLEVLDEGPGLGGTDPAVLFRPFQRAHQGERAGSSLGLGLALVARVAQAHGGQPYARDRDRRGACVGFSIALEQAGEP
jgi:signal transduction histidine kinase